MQWYSTHVKLLELLDSSLYPPQWVVTKGKRTKVLSTQTSPPGGGCLTQAGSSQATTDLEPRPELGRRVKIVETGRDIVLFRHGSRILAMDPACPHMKGDLACGDIENIGIGGMEGGGQYSELKERETHELLQRKLEAVTLAQADMQVSTPSNRRSSVARPSGAQGTPSALQQVQLHNPAGEGLCITCPVHGWSFSCSTGVSSKPLYRLGVYPTKLRWPDGQEVQRGQPEGGMREVLHTNVLQGGAQVTVCYPEGESLEAYGSGAPSAIPLAAEGTPGQLSALAPPHIHAAAGRRASTGPLTATPFVLTPPQVDTSTPMAVQRGSGPGRPPAAPRPSSSSVNSAGPAGTHTAMEGTQLDRGSIPFTVAAAVAGSVRTPGPEGYAAATIDYESSSSTIRRSSLGGLPAAVLANMHEQGGGLVHHSARVSAGMSPMAESSSLPRSVPVSLGTSLRVSPHGTPGRPQAGAVPSPMAGDKGSPAAHRLSHSLHASSGTPAAPALGLGSGMGARRSSGAGWSGPVGQEGAEAPTPLSPRERRIPPISTALQEAALHPWAEAVIYVGLPQGLDAKLFNPDCADF